MKKFAKLSLATSIALASFSCANAQDLEQAIKNVDVSGTVTYRYDDYEESSFNKVKDNFQGSTNNKYKIAINAKAKVNEDIVANTRFIVGSDLGAGNVSYNSRTKSDEQLDVTLSEVNFTYTGLANTSITLGKQGLATPYTVHRDAMDREQTGTGILAVTNVGPVTLAGAYFNQTNLKESSEVGTIDGSKNVVFLGAMANFAGVNIDASYIDLDDTFDAYTIGLAAKYNVGDVNLAPYARYTSLDLDNSSLDNKLWKIGMRANMGIFGAHLGYGQTDEEGGLVGLDLSSTTGYDEHWNVYLSNKADSSVVYASIDAQVMPKLNVALKYSNLDDDKQDAQDEEEIYTQVTYNMSKNLTTYVRFGQYEIDNYEDDKKLDSTRGRVHIQYSF